MRVYLLDITKDPFYSISALNKYGLGFEPERYRIMPFIDCYAKIKDQVSIGYIAIIRKSCNIYVK